MDTAATRDLGDGLRRAVLAAHPRLSKFDPLPRIVATLGAPSFGGPK